MKRYIVNFCSIIVLCVLLVTSAGAKTLFQYGDLLVTNEHTQNTRSIFYYDGYLQTNLRTLYQGNRADRGYIRYQGGADGDTQRQWTNYSRGETVSVSEHYRDKLDLWAPVVQFNYDFEWTPGSPHDII